MRSRETRMYENEITLPLYSKLTNDEVYYIIDSFRKAIR